MSSKNGIMLAILIVALVGAGWFFTRGSKKDVLDDPNTITHWMCEKCSKHIDLTFQQYDEWRNSPDKIRRDPKFKGRQIVFMCPDCKTYTVVGAEVDPVTKKWSMAVNSEGQIIEQPPPPAEAPAPSGN